MLRTSGERRPRLRNLLAALALAAASSANAAVIAEYPFPLVSGAVSQPSTSTATTVAANANNDASTVTVESGAKIDIAFSGNDTVATLNLGGTNVGPGPYGTDYVIQTSSDLTAWSPVAEGDVTLDVTLPGKSVSHTLTGSGKRFVRLLANPN